MASVLSARQALRLPRQLRLFSTSLSRGSGSTDVKRLGVVGAGQMVSPPLSLNPRLYVADHGLSWSTGLGDCPRGRRKGPGARYPRRLGAKLPGQGHWLCRLVPPAPNPRVNKPLTHSSLSREAPCQRRRQEPHHPGAGRRGARPPHPNNLDRLPRRRRLRHRGRPRDPPAQV